MHDEAITYPLISIHDTASVGEAARLMADCSAGAIGVLNEKRDFEGIFTERDLTQVVASHRLPFQLEMREVVNDSPVIVDGPINRSDAAEAMGRAHIRHLIVRMADGEHRVISMRDLHLHPVGRDAAVMVALEGDGELLRAIDVMSSPVVACRPDALIEEISEILADRDISGMPVLTDEGEVVGVVSERDVAHAVGGPLVRLALRRHSHDDLFLRRPHPVDFGDRRAANIMTRPALVTAPDVTLPDLATRMLQEGVNRLPVVGEGTLVGIVTRGDVLLGLADHHPRPDRRVKSPTLTGAATAASTRPSPFLRSMGVKS